MSELKPCPICGCRAGACEGMGSTEVECQDAMCGTMGPTRASREDAITAWNHRPGEEAVAEECARIADSGLLGADAAAAIRRRFGGKA